MNPVPLIPDTAPFTPEQRAWLNGFLAGVFSRSAQTPNPGAQTLSSAALQPLTILFGSQTGTAEALAKKAAKEAGKRGFAPTVLDMAQTDLAKLANEKNLLIITSTYGDGEPPDNAKALHTALKSEISNLKFPPHVRSRRHPRPRCDYRRRHPRPAHEEGPDRRPPHVVPRLR